MKKVFYILFGFLNTFFFGQSVEEILSEAKYYSRRFEEDKAFPLFKKAAELGSGAAQYDLAYYYQKGYAVEKSIQKAIYWYEKSIENNFAPANDALISIYNHGWEIQENKPLAFEYAMRCANQNNTSCMWYVAMSYLDGNGVEKNDYEGEKMLIKLAKSDHQNDYYESQYIIESAIMLAGLYNSGKFLEIKSDFLSYVWYLIYNEMKSDYSEIGQRMTFREILDTEKKLTKEQIEKSILEAEKILEKKLEQVDNLYKIVPEKKSN